MANEQDDISDNRKPPPAWHRFLKGKSGNPSGRPKGSISKKRLVRKIALTKRVVAVDGTRVSLTILELMIMKLKALAAEGNPSAIAVCNHLASTLNPPEWSRKFGYLVVPECLSIEESVTSAEEHNARHPCEPGTYVDVWNEEFMKAVRGEDSPLGAAIRAYNAKWS
jgi:hypothetical protein